MTPRKSDLLDAPASESALLDAIKKYCVVAFVAAMGGSLLQTFLSMIGLNGLIAGLTGP